MFPGCHTCSDTCVDIHESEITCKVEVYGQLMPGRLPSPVALGLVKLSASG